MLEILPMLQHGSGRGLPSCQGHAKVADMATCGADFDLKCSACGTEKWTVRAEVRGKSVCGACLRRGPPDRGAMWVETDLSLWQRVRMRDRAGAR